MLEFIRKIGTLRLLHAMLLAALILSAPFAGGESARSGLAMWPTLIAPALVPIFVFVLPLDMTMAAISRAGEEGAEHARLTTVLRFDLLLLVLLLGAWLPFFMALLDT
ncbi:MAG: hypothetical protein DWQ08_05615 [Proteobacteria bacterium]|nr:MAG: hypothetical protein DWQ08_05615 [Pseudomonadota bacterium]